MWMSYCPAHGLLFRVDRSRAFNLPSLQILRIDKEGMINAAKRHLTSFVLTSYDVICAKILFGSERRIYFISGPYLAACICIYGGAINCGYC